MAIDLLEWREQAITAASGAAEVAGTFVFDHPDVITVSAIFGILILGHRWWVNRKKKEPQGEFDEMKRMVQLESLYADKIGDFMLDMLVNGEITRKEYKRDTKRFGIAYRLVDMLRPVRSKIGIKHKVLRNVRANHATLPFIQAEKIPGPKPGEVPPPLPSKSKRKVWIAVGKRRKAA